MQKKNFEAHYFLNLTIGNVRCFGKEQTIKLCDEQGVPKQWTIILGDNGVGKTTLLKAFAVGYYWPKASIGDDSGPKVQIGWLNDALDIRFQMTEASIKWEIGQCETGILHQGEKNTSEFEERPWRIAEVSPPIQIIKNSISVQRSNGTPNIQLNVELPRVKLLGYGASRRMSKKGLTEENDFASLQLFDDELGLSNAEEWLAVQEFQSLRETTPNSKVEKIKSMLCELLEVEEIKLIGNYKKSEKLAVVVVNDFGEIGIRDLSLGFRTLIAWTVDLARWMYEWYPECENPLTEPAVVLVDEIDLHLHPKFQRRLMEFLTAKFPRVQFIVTAHSPLIVQSAENANVVLLKKEGSEIIIDQQKDSFVGWRIDQILASELFSGLETMSMPATEMLERHQELSGKDKLNKAELSELRELENIIESWPVANSKEDLAAAALIRKAAAILKSNPGKAAIK